MIQNNILINTETRNIKKKDYDFLGVAGENNIEQIVFKLSAFIDGEAILEIEKYNKEGKLETHYFELQKQDESYLFEVKSSLLDVAKDVKMQLHITTANEEVFKSNIFTMKVREAINATKTIPEEYESWIDSANSKIAQMQQLEETVTKNEEERKQAETERTTAEESRNKAEKERIQSEKARQESDTSRSTAESIRKKNESDRIVNENGRIELENSRNNEEETRQANESKRIANESARKLAEENREKTTKEAVNNIKDLSASYEQLAKEKETELNTHKTTLETEMTNTKDNLVQEIETAQNGFDENATLKKIAFNNNVTEQTNTFNTNAETKTNDFNTNASTKQTEYDDNATSKLEEYNSNSTAKVNEFNENAESYEKRIAELETERDEVAQQMPWNTTDISESIHIEDSAKYSRNKLDVFGNLKQKTRSGKNKFNAKEKLNASTTKNNITYTKNADNTFDISGTASANTLINVATVTDIIQRAKSYYLYSSKEYNLATFNLSIVVKYSDGDTQYIGANKSNVTTLTDKEIKSATLDFYAAEGITVNASNVKIMLVESDTVDNEFEEYGAMPSIDYPSMPVVATGVQKIRQFGKNWFDANNANILDALLSYGGNLTSSTKAKVLYVPCNPGLTYTISKKAGKCLRATYSGLIPVLGETFSNVVENMTGSSLTITTDYKSKYLIVYYYNSNLDTLTEQEILESIQIELGSTATERKPYNGEDITLDLGTTELCAIKDANGNVVAQDRAVYREVGGVWKWQWEKNVAKIILNGTETWKFDPLQPNCNYRSFYTTSITKIKAESFVISNLLKNNIDVYYYDYLGIYVNWQSSIRLKNGVSTTVKELQNWLSANNLTCYLVSKTPEYEDCTAEQSEVLDKLHKLQLEQGTNNIFVESENGVTTELQLTYMQDRIMLEEAKDKEFDDRITALEAMVVANASEEV